MRSPQLLIKAECEHTMHANVRLGDDHLELTFELLMVRMSLSMNHNFAIGGARETRFEAR